MNEILNAIFIGTRVGVITGFIVGLVYWLISKD